MPSEKHIEHEIIRESWLTDEQTVRSMCLREAVSARSYSVIPSGEELSAAVVNIAETFYEYVMEGAIPPMPPPKEKPSR